MIVLITGASHTGKTALAQKLLEKYTFSFAYNLTIKHVNRPKFMCFFCARKSIVKPSGKNLSLINYY